MTRSNRSLTQAMIDHMHRLCHFETDESLKIGNTEVVYYPPAENGWRRCVVKLFGEPIFDCTGQGRRIKTIAFFNGNFFDREGRPSRTTRERINGILARGGDTGTLPEGVRCFINRETGQCCIGKGDICRVLDKDNPVVGLVPSKDELIFV